MVVGAGNQGGAAVAGVHDLDREVEAGEVDGGGQAGGAAADDQAVEIGFGHGGRSASRRGQFHLMSASEMYILEVYTEIA